VFNAVLAKRARPGGGGRPASFSDTGDGAAVTFMGDPEDALFAAMSVRDMGQHRPVRLGVRNRGQGTVTRPERR